MTSKQVRKYKKKQSWKTLEMAAKQMANQRNASSHLLRHNLNRLPVGHVRDTIFLPLDVLAILLSRTIEHLEEHLPEPDHKGKVRFKVVEMDDKKYVCALSGHSIPGATEALGRFNLVKNLSKDEIKDRCLVHATTPEGYTGIMESGFLEPRGRSIHFTSTNQEYKQYPVPGKTCVNGGGHFALKYDASLENYILYLAENGVILCDTKIPVNYFDWCPYDK
jgi:RNA:NAD 2'-phosphotransferase (TPT1/KptA family)